MISLKSKYPNDTPWDNSKKYVWKAESKIKYTGYGCTAFAFMLSDAAFGTLPAKKHTDVDKIKVGDVVRINDDTHTIVILKVLSDRYIVAEGNVAGKVLWESEVLKSYIVDNTDYIYTRW